MQNLELDVENVQVSIYINIILNTLKKHKELSVNKMLLFTYLIKKEKFVPGKIYTANNTQDVVYKTISMINGEYLDYCESIKFIIEAIHLLIINNKISLKNSMLHSITEIEVDKCVYPESLFMEKAIEESKRMSDRQFMKEVIASV